MATIQGIYIALFGRPADPVGLDYFNRATNNGANLTAIGDLASTAEYQTRFQGKDSIEIVTAIYQSLFARNPEQQGLTFFVEALAAGTFTINNVAIAILDGAQGPDREIINNKIAAASVFTAAIDTGDELAAYRGDKAADAGRAFITPVTADDDTIPSEDQADAAIALLVSGPAPSSQFALTEGFDTADTTGAHVNGSQGDPGTVANFKFTGADESIIATSDTLGRFDSLIDAVTTDSDRLQLSLTGDVIFPAAKNIEIIEIDGNTTDQSTVSLALVEGAKTLDLNGLLGGRLTITDAFGTGITVVDGSGLKSAVADNGFSIDFSASTSAVALEITGSRADDVLKGGAGNDSFTGGEGKDGIFGGAGNDTLDGGGTDDAIVGGTGDDIIRGGSGNDILGADDGRDTVTGGAGLDQILLFRDAVAGLNVPDGASDIVVFESTAAANGIDSISGFEVGGATDQIDARDFLPSFINVAVLNANTIGAGGTGFNGSAFSIFMLAADPDVNSQEELTAAIGSDPTDLKLDANTSVLVGFQDSDDTRLFYVTTDNAGAAASVELVAVFVDVNASQFTNANFV